MEGIEGHAGRFTVTLREHPRFVDINKCIACGVCAEKCPRKVEDAFNEGLNKRKAAYVQYPQAVPLKYAIDADHCIYFEKGKCRACEKFCPAGAIDFNQNERIFTIEVGSVVLALGARHLDPSAIEEYGYSTFPNVITGMQMERILSATGPYQGRLVRPSDGQPPKKIAWIQCVGSRSTGATAHEYCSGVCCMYAIKEAVIAKEHAGRDLDAAIFFMDMRTHGKEFERYYRRAESELGVRFIRSRVHSVESSAPGSDSLKVRYADDTGAEAEEIFDLVVLSNGLETSNEVRELADRLGVAVDENGFVKTACLSPLETSRKGIFVCGSVANPADIPQAVMEASAASSAAARLLAKARGSQVREKEYPAEKPIDPAEIRVGVFVCHCGINISSVVDVTEVRDYAKTLPGVVYSTDNLFSCSQDTQQTIRDAVTEHRLNRVVVAACTPRTHEPLFQETIREAGLNPYLLEFANIRDQDAWVHQGCPEEATVKAKDLVRMAVSKVTFSEPVERLQITMHKSALVVGGGVAGMTAALGLAEQGFPVHLIERNGNLGGNARNIRATWKGEDVRSYVEELSKRVIAHPDINVLLNARIESVSGFVGNFLSRVRKGGRSEEISHGVAIISSGGGFYKPEEYLYGQHERVTCWHELEDLFEKEPERLQRAEAVVLIQCVGSRDEDRPYCSRLCCTASLQQAVTLKTRKPDLEVYVLYRDLRSYGLREELYRKARELGVIFFRYTPENKPAVSAYEGTRGKLNVTVQDHVLNIPISLDVDYVNLFSAILPQTDNDLPHLFKVPTNTDGFFLEAHAKLRPVDFSTEGVFVCGLAHYPKPIEESIAQAEAASSRAAGLLARGTIEVEPVVSVIDQERCVGCGFCEASCPFGAVKLVAVAGKGFRAENIPALCKGCGICAAGCPQKAIDIYHFRDNQILASVQAGGETTREAKASSRPSPAARVTFVSGYLMRRDCMYHVGHTWIERMKGGRLRIGVDDFAGKILGPVDRLNLPPRGEVLRQDRKGWSFLRASRRAPFLSPVTGKVFDINLDAVSHPENVLKDPYGDGWLLVVEPKGSEAELKHLLYGEAGFRWMEEENRKLLELLGPEYERLAASGGGAVEDVFGIRPEIGWETLVKTFLRTEV
ncbi:MAG: heterodisulfide reductase [Deltaproteobacteria bacterium]|nr:MAG: heterodisulfide reductase [Deltaproteobacteria bacterium]